MERIDKINYYLDIAETVVETAAIDIDDIIANDPNQITEAPDKPKRGWWRR